MRSELHVTGMPPAATWPERLQELASRWHGPLSPDEREQVRSEIWVLLVGALDLKLRRQIGRNADVDAELSYDLAMQRALDLFSRFARGQWDPRSTTAAQLQSYFTLLARNGLVDHLRSRAGRGRLGERSLEACPEAAAAAPADELVVHRSRLAEALAACSGRLTRRARTAWFLRVFYDLSSRQIAEHPGVDMAPTAVDMALSRARRAIQDCLREQGFDRADFGVGVFTACWEAFHRAGGFGDGGSESEER
ncbi:MAG: hypothetical protein R3D98_11675 [Candidatus Krumholzibacteriia bacterium]